MGKLTKNQLRQRMLVQAAEVFEAADVFEAKYKSFKTTAEQLHQLEEDQELEE